MGRHVKGWGDPRAFGENFDRRFLHGLLALRLGRMAVTFKFMVRYTCAGEG